MSPTVAAFIDIEFDLARQVFETGRELPTDAARAEAAAFYRSVVEQLER